MTRLRPHQTTTAQHQRARKLRRDASSIEQKFWAAVRKQLHPLGLKFRRQQPIAGFVVDFVCMQAKLIIELDGWSHDTQLHFDAVREQKLRGAGYLVRRFTNADVLENLAGVLMTVLNDIELSAVTPSPRPSPSGGEGALTMGSAPDSNA